MFAMRPDLPWQDRAWWVVAAVLVIMAGLVFRGLVLRIEILEQRVRDLRKQADLS
jgi:hypothetical protein